ncbi:hypothetical protein [Ureibacillus chungkukjangi]|nr:hypothetical protein [Ureibacillus chungkukjangi]
MTFVARSLVDNLELNTVVRMVSDVYVDGYTGLLLLPHLEKDHFFIV